MKGLVEKGEGGIHLHVKHGNIVQESRHPQEGFTPIEVTNIRTGDVTTKYIKRYKGVEALVKKIEWYDREYEGTPYQGWKLLLDADGTICTLDFPFESRVGSRFAKLAENIDFSQPVEFSAWKGTDDKTAFSVKQNGENVPQKYTRENPGKCPPPTQGFNKKWNFDAQKEFLHERMMNVVLPKVQALNGTPEPSNGDSPSNGDAPTNGNNSDVLKDIQSYLKDYAAQEKVALKDAIETWFGTRNWLEVEKTDPSLLQATLVKLTDAVAPF